MRIFIFITLLSVALVNGYNAKNQDSLCNNDYIVYSSTNNNDHQYKLLNVNTKEIEYLPNSDYIDSMPQWSPDHSLIAFESWLDRGFEINVMNQDGTDLRKIATGIAESSYMQWSPDGSMIAFYSERQTFLVNINSGEIRQATNGEFFYYPVEWSLDGTSLIVSEYEPGTSLALSLFDVVHGEAYGLTTPMEYTFDYFVSWTLEGDILFNSNRLSEHLSLHLLDIETGSIIHYSDWFIPSISWTSNRESFVYMLSQPNNHPNESTQNIYLMDWLTGTTTQITDGNTIYHENYLTPVISPDDRHIVFETSVDGDYELFIIDIDGSNLQQLTFNNYNDTSPKWITCVMQ